MKILEGKAQYYELIKAGSGWYNVAYAEKWAEAMEVQLALGKTVAEIAEVCHQVTGAGITDSMFAAAVSILGQAWQYGGELLMWYNAEYGLNDPQTKGGIINLASPHH